tara:strand:+ start:231 stop:593 length:363 start_codon:yes stop_codon:yes gene_type:complete
LIGQKSFKMNLQCRDYYFYPDSEYRNVAKWDSQLYSFDNEIRETSRSIRIFGTDKQIDKAFDDYSNITGLNLDECYTYQVEKKGTFFYNKEKNKVIAERLKRYKELYKEKENKTLILRTK